MKKIILTLFSFQFSLFTSFAQPATGTCPSDKTHKWGIGVQVNTIDKFFPYGNLQSQFDLFHSFVSDWEHKSISLGLIINYCIDENLDLRVKGGIVNINKNLHIDTKRQSGPCISCFVWDETNQQKRFYFSPGIAWNVNKDKFMFYVGFEFPLMIYQDYEVKYTQFTYDTTYTITKFIESGFATIPGGFSVGPGAFAGFNISLARNFSIGAEYYSSFLFYKLGGKVNMTSNTTYPIIETINSYYYYTNKDFGISNGNMSINIAHLF